MTTVEDVLSFLRTVITEMKDVEEDEIQLESRMEDLALDSLDYVEIQLAVKKQYGANVAQTDFVKDGIKTIGDFCAFVSSAITAGQSGRVGERAPS